MEHFTYCYLSPTIVGLVLFIAIVLGVVGAILATGWLYTWIDDNYGHKIYIGGQARQIIDTTGDIALYAITIISVIALGTLIAFGAWQIGIQVLKRFVCL